MNFFKSSILALSLATLAAPISAQKASVQKGLDTAKVVGWAGATAAMMAVTGLVVSNAIGDFKKNEADTVTLEIAQGVAIHALWLLVAAHYTYECGKNMRAAGKKMREEAHE